MNRLVRADLRLQECVAWKDLSGHRVEAEGRHTAAKSLVAVAARYRDFSEAADDRVVAGEQHALEADGHVADAVRADAVLVSKAGKRDGEFELVACAQSIFVRKLAVDLGRAARCEA